MNDFLYIAKKEITKAVQIESQYQRELSILNQLEVRLQKKIHQQEIAKKALIVIQIVAQNIQSQLEKQITTLVNLAIQSIFDDAPIFKMDIVIRRNKTECDLLFENKGEIQKPIDSFGGGLLDIVSFALRVVIWSFTTNSNTLILDEPFKFLSPNLSEKASNMLSELSKKLNLQIIMVSHAEEINICADKLFILKKQNDCTIVTKG